MLGWAGRRQFTFCGRLLRSDGACRFRSLFKDDARSAVGSDFTKLGHGDILRLPVLIDPERCVECACCGEACNCPSPLADAADDDRYGGFRPWKKYAISFVDASCKTPINKLCLICWRVFMILGYHLIYGSLPKYLSHVRAKPEEHRKMLKGIKEFIKAHNDNPDASVLQLQTIVRDASTVVDQVETSGCRQIRRRTFILEKTFNELYAGTPAFKDFEAEKDNHFVSKRLGLQAGYWISGAFNTHLPNHFEYEDYEDISTVYRTRHETGGLQLSKDQAMSKFAALQKDASQERARVEQKLSCISAMDLLRIGLELRRQRSRYMIHFHLKFSPIHSIVESVRQTRSRVFFRIMCDRYEIVGSVV